MSASRRLAAVLSTFFVLAGCGDDGGSDGSGSSGSSGSSEGSASGDDGSSATRDGVTLTVLGSQTTLNPIGGTAPSAGDQYVIVEVALKNASGGSIPLLPTAFSVIDDAGVEYHGDPRTELVEGGCDANASVATDGATSCTVVFVPPEDAKLERLSYEWEEGRVETDFSPGGEGGGTPTACGPGHSIVAVSVQLDNTRPLYFGADVEREGAGLAITFTPLASPYLDRNATPYAPVGDPVVVHVPSVGADGAIHFQTGTFEVPGDANSISGAPITGDLAFNGQACSTADGAGYCGSVSGLLTEPVTFELDAARNSFAFNLSTPGVYDCAGSVPVAP